MEDAKNKKVKKCSIFFFFLILLILLCLHYCGNVTGDKQEGLAYESNGSLVEEISDEAPLGSKGKIVFPGFSTEVIKYNSSRQMSLANPKVNSVDFVYTIVYNNKEVYKSGFISPGVTQKWNLHEVFTQKGRYEVTIHITPYDDGGTVKNGINQSFTFEII